MRGRVTAKTNKINFYLLKEGMGLADVFKDPLDELDKYTVKEGLDLYYNRKSVIAAPWVKDFFKTEIKVEGFHVFNAASSQAVLVKKVTVAGKELTFAICFGTGVHMLKKGSVEPRFGLLSVLNIVGDNSLRRIDKHDISGTPKFTAEQLAKKGGQLDFGLDFELDILLGVTGALDKENKRERPLYKLFGPTLTGKSGLVISAKFDVDNIDRLLKASYVAFKSKRYTKKGFDWIDKIDLVKKKTPEHDQLTEKLNESLAQTPISPKVWLAVPELVEWQNIKGFYFGTDQDNIFGDVSLRALQGAYPDLTVEKLHSIRVNFTTNNLRKS